MMSEATNTTTERVIIKRDPISESTSEMPSSRLTNTTSHHDADEEEILQLVQRVFLAQGAVRPQVVLFAGIASGSRCTKVSISVAKVLSHILAGSVCLVEANLKDPVLASNLGVTNSRGLREALVQSGPILSYARQLPAYNLWLLPAGVAAVAPGILGTETLRDRIAELKAQVDFVLIDCQSLSQSADAISIGRWSDGLILVLEANATRREDAVEATQSLRNENIPILAAVLTNQVSALPAYLENRL